MTEAERPLDFSKLLTKVNVISDDSFTERKKTVIPESGRVTRKEPKKGDAEWKKETK